MGATQLIFLTLLALSLANERDEYFMRSGRALRECQRDYGGTTDDLLKLIRSERTDIDPLPIAQATFACYLRKKGYLINGNFNWDTFKLDNNFRYGEENSVQKADQVVEACKKKFEGRGMVFLPVLARCLIDTGEKVELQEPHFLLIPVPF